MHSVRLRLLANAIVTVFSLLIVTYRLIYFNSSGLFWLWGALAIIITVLDIYFLTKSLLNTPKNIDTRISTFFISVGSSLGFGLSAAVITCPPLTLSFISQLRQLGSIVAIIPYPLILWALFCLKNCLTVIPEAHTVVAHGIYKYSRHPLYMCYMLWAIANIMMFPSWQMMIVSSLHILFLMWRLKREETLLLSTFPEYRDYYEKTGLIGGIRL
jgi:protein-S-isoprenylcysteine O-methyltransferase Ste14